jgi:hypothetical protein
MTVFGDREKALENKYIHDQELVVKVTWRRRKLLALWAAQQMKLGDEDALQYALDIVRLSLKDKDEGGVVTRVKDDLIKAGVNASERDVRAKMDELHAQARHEVVELGV